MDKGILKIRVEKSMQESTEGVFIQGTVQLFSSGAKLDEAPLVNLNRAGDGCSFPIDDLQSHNSHMPTFQTVGQVEMYLNRVQSDVTAAVEGYEGGYTEKEEE
jgi:hypothetical protein